MCFFISDFCWIPFLHVYDINCICYNYLIAEIKNCVLLKYLINILVIVV